MTIKGCSKQIGNRQSLFEAVRDIPRFPPILTNMVDIKERTDRLARFLDTVVDIYKGTINATVMGLTSILEARPVTNFRFIPRDVVLCAMVPIFQPSSTPCGLFEP